MIVALDMKYQYGIKEKKRRRPTGKMFYKMLLTEYHPPPRLMGEGGAGKGGTIDIPEGLMMMDNILWASSYLYNQWYQHRTGQLMHGIGSNYTTVII